MRKHFGIIVWIALGQTPNLLACQRQLFAQLTGGDLPVESTPEQKLEAIQAAFAGKHCLLVLDDCWEAEHLAYLVAIDETTSSRVLISSRVVSSLDACEVVDIGRPTEADAIQMVMAAAGMAAGTAVPPEAKEVVNLCKLLPLTLGIAGKMVGDLGLQNEWSEVTTMMHDELSTDGEARSAEDLIISTSLKAISGRHADNARALLSAFRLVPEDCRCPLEALQIMYQASEASSAAPSLLQLRRWTKILIDRCLVLGPIDQPSLHDIVKDYASSLDETSTESLASYRRCVSIFRASRPGPHGWDLEATEGRLAEFICNHVGHFIEHGWNTDETDEEQLAWLDDFNVSQDAIPLACARYLGTKLVSQLALKAEREGNWWGASLRWSATALATKADAGQRACQPLLKAAAASLLQFDPTTAQQVDAKQRLELPTLVGILLNWDPDDLVTYEPRLQPLLESNASLDNVEGRASVFLMTTYYPALFSVQRTGAASPPPEEYSFAVHSFTSMMMYVNAAEQAEPGSRKRARLLALAWNLNSGCAFVDMMSDAKCPPDRTGVRFSWDVAFGPRGSLLNELAVSYDFATHHKLCLATHSFDANLRTSWTFPFFARWGDLKSAHANCDRSVRNFKQFIQEPVPDGATLGLMLCEWPQMLYLLGREADAAELLTLAKADWTNADKTLQQLAARTPLFSMDEATPPAPSPGGAFLSAKDMTWQIKMLFVLCTDEELEVSAEQILAELPSPEELGKLGVWRGPDGISLLHLGHYIAWTSVLWAALALEKLGQGEAAMTYATKVLDTDQTQGGGHCGWQQSLAHRCRGRLLAASGELDLARVAFVEAETSAAAHGYWMFEALAVKDLVEHVLEPSGQLADDDERKARLAPFVTKLARSNALAAFLGDDGYA